MSSTFRSTPALLERHGDGEWTRSYGYTTHLGSGGGRELGGFHIRAGHFWVGISITHPPRSHISRCNFYCILKQHQIKHHSKPSSKQNDRTNPSLRTPDQLLHLLKSPQPRPTCPQPPLTHAPTYPRPSRRSAPLTSGRGAAPRQKPGWKQDWPRQRLGRCCCRGRRSRWPACCRFRSRR